MRRLALACSEHQRAGLAADRRHHRRGITRAPLVAHLPQGLAGLLVEGRDADPGFVFLFAADIYDNPVPVHHRRRPVAEEVLWHRVFLRQVALPDHFALVGAQAVETGGHPGDVNPAVIDHRARPRAGAEAVAVLVLHRIREAPDDLAGFRFAAFEGLLAVHPMEVEETAAGEDRARIAVASLRLPNDRGTTRRPLFEQRSLAGRRVEMRAEEVRPLFHHRALRQRSGLGGEQRDRSADQQREDFQGHR